MKKAYSKISLEDRKLFTKYKYKTVLKISHKRLKPISKDQALRQLYLNKAKIIREIKYGDLAKLEVQIYKMKQRS